MKKESTHSQKRLTQALMEELNSALRGELASPKIQFVSITGVELNKDNSVAKVFWDTFKSNEVPAMQLYLDELAPKLRGILARKLQLRHTPELRLVYNSQFEDAMRIDQLLKEKN
jgi:ribosome-binding factor A